MQYGDTLNAVQPPTPSINMVGFMEQSVERLAALRRTLTNANNRLTGNSAPDPIQQRPARAKLLRGSAHG